MLIVSGECESLACLIESSDFSNEKERNLIITDEYENKIFNGIIQCIYPFFI